MRNKNQIELDLPIEKISGVSLYDKKRWRKALQDYCDEQSWNEGSKNGYCVCGYMNYCDCCMGADKTNCCVKAICELAKQKGIEIDIQDYDFESLIEKVETK